ncbi:MAG: hypothetical protein JSS44_02835 [Proteobacteria bacterium]|nr:hypothetical protein [Pseudomonadota bacterium]
MGSAFKQKAHQLIDTLPEAADWEELAEQIEIILDLRAGLADSAADRVIDNARLRAEFGLQ